MSRIGSMSRTRKIATLAGVLAMLGGGIALSMGTSNAAESDSVVCQGLNQALQNNQNFIAGQQANPDAASAGRIANRQAVVDQIQSRRQAAGCGDAAAAPAAGNANAGQQNSGESCAALDTALQNNQNFIAGQQTNPDANSAARIANRQAVIDLIQSRRQAAGCNGDGAEAPAAEEPAAEQPAEEPAAEEPAAEEPADNAGDDANAGNNAGGGDVVCDGSTVTVSGEGGAPGASSNEFPLGTQLRVTNLDNNKVTTVPVTSVSGSCILLNNAAFEQVREAGKFVIRRAVIERVG